MTATPVDPLPTEPGVAAVSVASPGEAARGLHAARAASNVRQTIDTSVGFSIGFSIDFIIIYYSRLSGLYPSGHLMEMLRPHLSEDVVPSHEIRDLEDGAEVTVAGLVIRRQRPLARRCS